MSSRPADSRTTDFEQGMPNHEAWHDGRWEPDPLILDEQALYDALAAGRLAGAALDVWYRYPAAPGPTVPASQPFGELDNVIMTPHVSGWTEGMLDARVRLIAENIACVARQEQPTNSITRS